jgi:hypothetical protein
MGKYLMGDEPFARFCKTFPAGAKNCTFVTGLIGPNRFEAS